MSSLQRPGLIVAQHTFGLICDMDEINRIAERHGIVVIEDGAHALGARHRGRPAGSLALAAYFSTDHTKMIGTGVGGMITTDSDEVAQHVREIQRSSPFLPGWKARLSLLDFAIEVLATHPFLYRWLRLPYKVLWRLVSERAFSATSFHSNDRATTRAVWDARTLGSDSRSSSS